MHSINVCRYVGVHIILPIAGYVDIVIVDSINRVDSHTDSGSVTGDCCTICYVSMEKTLSTKLGSFYCRHE